MKTASAGLMAHLAQTVTTLAKLWHLTRIDGVEFFFTSHDKEIVFGGDTYVPQGGFSSSAFSMNSSLAVDNQDVEGLFVLAGVDEDDLRAGLFNFAEFTHSIVNYEDLGQGELKIRRGRLGEVVLIDSGVFRVELRSMTQALSQNILEIYQPDCRTDLGNTTRCKIPIFPGILPRNTAVAVGEFYRVATLTLATTSYANTVQNGGFELDATGSGLTSIIGWTTTGDFRVDTAIGSLTPFSGAQLLAGSGTGLDTLSQIVNVEDVGLNLTELDAGNLTASFTCRRGNATDVTDTGRVNVRFLDADNVELGTLLDTGFEAFSPAGVWTERSASAVAIPTLTRFIEISVLLQNVSGGVNDAAIDAIALTFNDPNTANTTQEVYENRVYEVTVAGTTAVSQPVYDTTIDNTTVDGTATLTARDAFMRHGTIADKISQQSLQIAVTEARAVDGWFNGGVLTFDEGENIGLSIEIRDWLNTDGAMTIFLPMKFNFRPGNRVKLYPGCDKQLTTCINKFDNVINFQGDPFIPGTDEAARYPDAR